MPRKLPPAPRKIKLIASDRKLEGTVSLEIRRALWRMGMLSYKMSDRYRKGIPDIYVAGGLWIETKIIPVMPSIYAHPMKYFSGPQKTEANMLMKHGDQVFAALYFLMGGNNRAFVLMPWWEFWRISCWDLETVLHFGTLVKEHRKPNYYLERYFNKDVPGLYDSSLWFDAQFKAWLEENPWKFDIDKQDGKAAHRYITTYKVDRSLGYDPSDDDEAIGAFSDDDQDVQPEQEDSADRF